MAAGIFGALAALGGTGNQIAEGNQLAHDELVRRLQDQQQQETTRLAQQSTRQRIAKEQQDLVAGRQKTPLGPSYVSGGKTLQRFQNPIDGKVTVEELPGGPPETKIETTRRGLKAIGLGDDEATSTAIKMATGKTVEKREVQPDPASTTGYSAIYFDAEGNEIWRTQTLPPGRVMPKETIKDTTDPATGLTTHGRSVTVPLFPRAAPGLQAPPGAGGGPVAPPQASGAQGVLPVSQGQAILNALAAGNQPAATQPGARSPFMAAPNPKGLVEPGNLPIWNRPRVNNADGSHSSEYSTSFEDQDGHEVLVPTVVNGRFLTPDGKKPPEGSAAEKAMFRAAWDHYQKTGENLGKFDNPDDADAYAEVLHNRGDGRAQGIVSGLAASKVPAATKPPSERSTAPPVTAPISVGTYRGIQLAPDGSGVIPPRPGVPYQIRQAAEDIINGRDVQKLPPKVRLVAESVAKNLYGWKGQGSLTPAQQMQIEQVDKSLIAISDPNLLKLFDSTMGRLYMSTIPLDPTGEGGFAGMEAQLKRSGMSQAQTEYMNALTRLRGVIGGIRGFTGANNSNATADRLLAELPNFTNTKNSTDALNKIGRLRQEVQIIKRLGYFLPDAPDNVQPNAATSGADNHDAEADRILKQAGVIP